MSITSQVRRRARKHYGVRIIGRRKWARGNVNTMRVYWRRRRTHPHRQLPDRPTDTVWAHISVTHRDGLRKDMRELHDIGMYRFGSGVSYNVAIDMRTGVMALGQALDAAGTHTINRKGTPGYSTDQNLVSIAMVFIGMPGDAPSAEALRSAAGFIAACQDVGAVTESPDFVPHSLVAAKDCPTDAVRNALPAIMRMAAAMRQADAAHHRSEVAL